MLRLISINIERARHFATVLPFLRAHKPDVVCVQELFERDIPAFIDALHMGFAYAPMDWYPSDDVPGLMGVGIFSRFPITNQRSSYYVGDPKDISPTLADGSMHHNVLLAVDVEFGGIPYRVCTTHFTWTPKGVVNDQQRRALNTLLPILREEGEFVLTGDFNAPRGGEIFSRLAEQYQDNIPAHYATSLDPLLHRAGKDRLEEIIDKMIDGLFSTPTYHLTNVSLVNGVSDHCAVVADMQKKYL